MKKGMIYVYTGDDQGKSRTALGRAVEAAMEGQNVVIIRFLRGKGLGDSGFLRKLEPEIKIFHFEKSDESFEKLSEEKKQEEVMNIKNGIGYAKKVLATGECDLLVLDEVLGLVERKIISGDELKSMLECRNETGVILTGDNLNDEVCALADKIYKIETLNADT